MLLCPISPHLAHPRSLCCAALSQAASSFWSQQQCHPINPLAGYTVLYKRCCFHCSKSLSVISPCDTARHPNPFLALGLPAQHSWPCAGFAMWQDQPKYFCWGTGAIGICVSDFKSYISEKKNKKKQNHLQKQKAWVYLFWVGVNPLSLIKLCLIYNYVRGDSGP